MGTGCSASFAMAAALRRPSGVGFAPPQLFQPGKKWIPPTEAVRRCGGQPAVPVTELPVLVTW